MTTIAPIDLERDRLECVALVDLENIRLSWQRTYLRVFEYADLVLLCHLTERLMDTKMSRIVIFATDPKQYHAQQLKAVAGREKLLYTPSHTTLSDRDVQVLTRALNERGIKLPDDIDAGYRLIHQIGHDVSPCPNKSGVTGLIIPPTTVPTHRNMHNPTQSDFFTQTNSRKRTRTEMAGNTDESSRCESVADADSSSTNQSSSQKHAGPPGSHNESSDSNSLEELSSSSDENLSDVEIIDSDASRATESDDEEVEVVKEVWHPVISNNTGVKNASLNSKPESAGINVPISYMGDTTECVRCLHPEQSTDSVVLGGLQSGCKVELRLYGYKSQKGRVVQRGCDVALGAEITKACFHPNVDKICLFSADSDFQELMHQNLEAEDIGGVVKYAKTSWVCGFRQAFTSDRISGLRLHRRRPYFNHGQAPSNPEEGIISHGNINYVLLDEVFPQIRKMLEQKNIHRQPWNPVPPAQLIKPQEQVTTQIRNVKRTRSTNISNHHNSDTVTNINYHRHRSRLPPMMPAPQLPPILSP